MTFSPTSADVGRVINVPEGRTLFLGVRNGYIQASTEFTRFISRGYKAEQCSWADPLSKRAGFNLKEDLIPIIEGLITVPNFERVDDLPRMVDIIAAGGGLYSYPDIGHAKLPKQDRTTWARFFLSKEQSGGFSGSGYLLLYGGIKVLKNEAGEPIKDAEGKDQWVGGGFAGTFAICKHEYVTGAGANPRRGWHPSHCAKCGLNTTVDSSD
jgi:hypothetical protein